jgi:hypothetical protein
MNSPSTALYSRVPVTNRVRISRHCVGIRTQRPRPHMRWRVLRPLARTRLTPDRRRLGGRCRFDATLITHLHTTNVEVPTDNPDLSPRGHSESLLHAHLVFVTSYRRPASPAPSFTGATLTIRERNMRTVRADLDVELVNFNSDTDPTRSRTTNPHWWSLRRATPHRPRRAAQIHRPLCPRPHSRTSVVASYFVVSCTEEHRYRSPTDAKFVESRGDNSCCVGQTDRIDCPSTHNTHPGQA